MNIVYGLLKADSGEILVDGQKVEINEPADALKFGIGMVHQHFMLVPVFTVAENIVLGHEKTNRGLISLSQAKERIQQIAKEFKFEIDPEALIEDLPVGLQQRVEIIRALMYDARVLILDEPTAVLTPQETDELLNIMRALKAKGTSIIFITHKLREVKAVADKITIIRLGKVVASASPESTQEELASKMVGRAVDLIPNKTLKTPGKVVLSIRDLNIFNSVGRNIVKNISFEIKAGEILAIAGVQGNGQSEIARAIINLEEHVSGSIKVNDQEISGKSVKDSLETGIAFIPESREVDGLIESFSIAENLILDTHDMQPSALNKQLDREAINSSANLLIK